MRLIGHLQNESNAKTVADYLVSIDIRNQIEPDTEGWAVWVYSEDQLEAGRQALVRFLQNPGDVVFQRAAETAAAVHAREEKEKARFAKRVHTRDQIRARANATTGPVTIFLLVASVLVSAFVIFDPSAPFLNYLWISSPIGPALAEVRAGQIWRLVTPIFLHFSLMHLIFDVWVLWNLGTLVELRQGTRTFIILVLTLSITSNLGQYFYGGPYFGGLSGMLYGLVGYIWLRGRSDPASGLFLPSSTLAMMLVWYVLCLFGLMGDVANACHTVGLLVGMGIGAAPMAKRYL